MTTQAQQTLHFNVTKHGWKDAFVVSFLALVLGAFVAQISMPAQSPSPSAPIAATASTVPVRG
jgi:hypothetical protein